jgi:hypothetical protein
MIMNKKIFTLLVGALLSMTSFFTANAQVFFRDTLKAEPVTTLSKMGSSYYLLSVTGIANPSSLVQGTAIAQSAADADSSYVLFVDKNGELRVDNLKTLDFQYGGLEYEGSSKIGAIRQAAWCVELGTNQIPGSNVIYDFTNLGSNKLLQTPFVDETWTSLTNEGGNRLLYDKGINLGDYENLIVSGWHFSETFGTMPLQTNRALFSYVEDGYVLVLTLADSVYKDPTTNVGTGGWRVDVKYVATSDLIINTAGDVNTAATGVNNVLLFTLKKFNKFVLNADDYNAIRDKINFTPDAKNEKANNDGWNPFTAPGNGGIDPHARGILTAYEVADDSLYKYGYLQFENSANKWLYVDTAFWNYGVNQFLSFNWSDNRRDTTMAAAKWGFSFTTIPGLSSEYHSDGYPKNDSYEPDATEYTVPADYTADMVLWNMYGALSRARDSIVENQSKFRVVYDPTEDSTYINVYQSRVRYTDLTDPNNPNPFWKNSFIWHVDAGVGTIENPPPGANSFYGKIVQSAPDRNMDTVLISTADTMVFVNGEPLSHIYGWNLNNNGYGAYYRDTLIYIDIQDLEGSGGYRIATLDQSKNGETKSLNTWIKLGFAQRCKAEESDNGRATIENDLYLIRNAEGEYLCVPIYSITDSVYWKAPETWEDPTRMPSYQWVVENKRSASGSPFKLTNREFENVSFDYVYVNSNGKSLLQIGDPVYSAAKFAKEPQAIIRAGVPSKEEALGPGEFAKAKALSTNDYSFLRLNAAVKGDQLIGYKYIDRDAAYTDVYAFKYYHFLAAGGSANYMGWNGYYDSKDTLIYLNYRDYFDKLYFSLEEMPYENIGEDRVLVGYYPNGTKQKDLDDYKSIYDQYGTKENLYVNSDSIVLENFGYMPAKVNAKGETVYDYDKVAGLKPLARQAYRLLLKDYYKYDPNPHSGNYLTVGGEDNYILSERENATKGYIKNSGKAEGVFGLPFFYFRNTYFGIPGVNAEGNVVNEDYFALVQRLDTVSIVNGFTSSYEDVEEYVKIVFGSSVATQITTQIKNSKELGAFIATVDQNSTEMKLAVRGGIAVSPSTFTMERDEDPLYRRFSWNDKFERTNEDKPNVLEFHRLQNEKERLFENTGADTRSGGGYEFNLNKQGVLQRDSLGNVISFLGIKNVEQFPSVKEGDNPHGLVNYALYVDTAYINRGTGWIKPQYLLAVDPEIVPPCVICGDKYRGYTVARYLYNTSMYAKKVLPDVVDGGVVNYDLVQPVDANIYHTPINGVDGSAYTYSTGWERFAFAWAIHRGDSLYVLKNLEPYQGREYDAVAVVAKLTADYGTSGQVDFTKLIASKGKTKAELGDKIGLHAIINLGDNTHKDWVYSFRYIQRRSDDFIIESETDYRDRINGRVIRPVVGGWVKFENHVPTITRGNVLETLSLSEGFVMNVTSSPKIKPVGNDAVETTSDVKIVGGYGAVTVLNAAGKNIIITNIVGQTLANTIADSDNVSIAVAGNNTIVFVSVNGGAAEKALVK